MIFQQGFGQGYGFRRYMPKRKSVTPKKTDTPAFYEIFPTVGENDINPRQTPDLVISRKQEKNYRAFKKRVAIE